ncbi:unnamed protein product [Prunus brigantina]
MTIDRPHAASKLALTKVQARITAAKLGCLSNQRPPFYFKVILSPRLKDNASSLASNSDVSTELTICLFLKTHIHQSILPENTLWVQIGSKDSTFSFQCRSKPN